MGGPGQLHLALLTWLNNCRIISVIPVSLWLFVCLCVCLCVSA